MTTLAFELASLSENAASSATTTVGSTIKNVSGYNSVGVVATLRGVSGGTLDVYLQGSIDGTTWFDVAHFPQLASSAAAITYALGLTNKADPSIGIKAVGLSTAPALAANTLTGQGYGKYLRPLYVTGTGTSAGVGQVLKFFGYKDQI